MEGISMPETDGSICKRLLSQHLGEGVAGVSFMRPFNKRVRTYLFKSRWDSFS
jgi:hypothetical protein